MKRSDRETKTRVAPKSEPTSGRRASRPAILGGGELGGLVRAMDWAATPLGPVESWPVPLLAAVNLLLDSRHPMLLFWGPDLIKIYNDAYRPILGAKHPDALGKPARDVWPESWDQIGPRIDGVMTRGEATWADDLRFVTHRHGFPEETYFTSSNSPIRDESGAVRGIFCACTETTAKVIGQRRLRLLRDLAAAPAGPRSVDEACRASVAVLEENPAEVPLALVYLVDDGSDGRVLRLAASSGTRPFVDEAPSVLTQDEAGRFTPVVDVVGSGKPVELSDASELFVRGPEEPLGPRAKAIMILPLMDRAQARPLGAIVLGASAHRGFDDDHRGFFELLASQISASVANARALENERRRAEALAQLDRAKTAFFGNVGHEFRTPLTLMLGPTRDLLAGGHGTFDEPTRAQLKLIERNGHRLQKLVNSLLDFSRLEAGGTRATFERVDLSALTKELASAFASAFERAGVALVTDLAVPADTPVYVDRDMWEKIVLNLLSNALKFTLEGKVEIELRPHGNQVRLRVTDTGVGIPSEELPRLFERFHRVEGAVGRTHEGSGIGLALVQELVKIHGGTTGAESSAGRGSTFFVTLPTGSAHLPADRIRAERPHAPPLAGVASFVEEALRWLPDANDSDPPPRADLPRREARERILVVDDNADMRDYMRRHLGRFWIVDTVDDGSAALASALANPPDLVLTDVMMPGLDGFELLADLRAHPQTARIPVVILSARAGEEARSEGIEAGAVDYLTKPFASSELVARVETQLKMARLRADTARDRDRFYAMFEQAPMAVTVFEGKDLRPTFQNNAASTLFVSLENGDGRWHPGPVEEALRRTFVSGEPTATVESPLELSKLDGTTETRWLSAFHQPIREDDGTVVAVFQAAYDVTDHVLAREAWKTSERERTHMKEQTTRFSEMLVSVIGHDLRNPLSAIMTATGLLEARANSDKFSKPLGRIALSADRMERMISQLLDFGRLRLGPGIALDVTEVDVGALAATIRDEREPDADRPLTVTTVGNVTGKWDGDRLWQLLSHLVGNAFQYGPPGSPVEVRLDGTQHETVRIEVSNEGAIPDDLLPVVFEPFWHTEFGREKRQGTNGLGLGLFIDRQIVLAHGGTINVISGGEGTRFVVELPREQRGDSNQARANRTSAAPSSTIAHGELHVRPSTPVLEAPDA